MKTTSVLSFDYTGFNMLTMAGNRGPMMVNTKGVNEVRSTSARIPL